MLDLAEKGPCIILEPGAGERFWQPAPAFGDVTLRITPRSHPGLTFATGEQRLPPGGQIPRHSHEVAAELLFVLEGCGTAIVDGASHDLAPGDTVLLGHHVEHEITNTGEADLVLFFYISPPGLEQLLAGIGQARAPGEEAPTNLPSPDMMQLLSVAGFAIRPPAAPQPGVPGKGPALVIKAAEGASYWQPIPANGYATVKLSPLNSPLNDFAMGVQILEPGASLPEHAHGRNDELKLVVSGSGTGRVDGRPIEVSPGALVFTGRGVTHAYTNTGDGEMTILWLIRPPGLELMLEGIGEPREPGVPRRVADLPYRADAPRVLDAARLVRS